jgi:hypothetical protein
MKTFSEFLDDLLEMENINLCSIELVHPENGDKIYRTVKGDLDDKEAVKRNAEIDYHPYRVSTIHFDPVKYGESIDEEILNERKIVISFKGGTRKRRPICGKGMRSVHGRCIRQRGVEIRNRRQGALKRKRKLRSRGTGWKRKAAFRRQRSLRKRHASGLK